mmetsp:Transcript_66893/g.217576  ORF Transcript_66893/g.217576 Transcript_66893/m.217576 type:complete len:621 (-) Transcript_66893:103-1965(-)
MSPAPGLQPSPRSDGCRARCRGALAVAVAMGCVAPALGHSKQCAGIVAIEGWGRAMLSNANWGTPGLSRGHVEVTQAGEVRPHMTGRSYFSNECEEGVFDNSRYIELKLLGRKFSYTTNLFGAQCGCNAALYLVSMSRNTRPSTCSDYYCDANSVCGVACTEIDIQESNMYSFLSTLHNASDKSGRGQGFGGGGKYWSGRRDWLSDDYAPGSACIDTEKPFDVEVSFPVCDNGLLLSMDVRISQRSHTGQDCRVSSTRPAYSPEEFTAELKKGMTPAISYWYAPDGMQWMDGPGKDNRGGCQEEHPNRCAESVLFSNFAVEDIGPGYESPPTKAPLPPLPRPVLPAAGPGAGVLPTRAVPAGHRAPIGGGGADAENPDRWGEPARVTTLPPTPGQLSFRFAGIAKADDARFSCRQGEQLPMPRTTAEWASLNAAIRNNVNLGTLSTMWPKNAVWLGGQWSLTDSQWQREDWTPVGDLLWGDGQPSAVSLQVQEPWLSVDLTGKAHDESSERVAAVFCEFRQDLGLAMRTPELLVDKLFSSRGRSGAGRPRVSASPALLLGAGLGVALLLLGFAVRLRAHPRSHHSLLPARLWFQETGSIALAASSEQCILMRHGLKQAAL